MLSSACGPSAWRGAGLGATLTRDLSAATRRAAGRPGLARVQIERVTLPRFSIVLARPERENVAARRAPAIVFLPGRFAPEAQYESYARLLASRGYVVAVRGQYSWFYTDAQLHRDAIEIADWLRTRAEVDAARVAVAGHSMGGRNAIWAAAEDPRFVAVAAIEPGTIELLPDAAAVLRRLHAPLLLVGADEGWRGLEFCGRRSTGYLAYFDRAPVGTRLLEIHGADHVQMMDAPDGFGYGVCRVGEADSANVRATARGATVDFLAAQLDGTPQPVADFGAIATWMVRRPGRIRGLRIMTM